MKIIYIGLRFKKINQYKIGVGNFEQSVVPNISTFCSIPVNIEQTKQLLHVSCPVYVCKEYIRMRTI